MLTKGPGLTKGPTQFQLLFGEGLYSSTQTGSALMFQEKCPDVGGPAHELLSYSGLAGPKTLDDDDDDVTQW